MAQAVNRLPLTAEARFDPRPVWSTAGGISVTGTGFSPSTSGLSAVSIIPLMFHTHLHLNMTLLSEGQAGEAREPSKKQF